MPRSFFSAEVRAEKNKRVIPFLANLNKKRKGALDGAQKRPEVRTESHVGTN